MSDQVTPGKRVLSVLLDEDVIRQAQELTSDIGSTLAKLLEDFVLAQQIRAPADDAETNRIVDALGYFHLEHGLLSDEFPTL